MEVHYVMGMELVALLSLVLMWGYLGGLHGHNGLSPD